jgi:hypothetical protein
VKASATRLISAFRATAEAQKSSMSAQSALSAPAIMAAMPTRPEPAARSSTVLPATVSG